MNVAIEYKKMKRTGFLPAFFVGGVLAAAVPVVNMAVRSENYTGLDGGPVGILLGANWQMMATLDVLLIVIGACMMYDTEYSRNAMQKMCALPVRESSIFLGKFLLMAAACAVMLLIEAGGIFFCCVRWFEDSKDLQLDILKNFGYSFWLLLPAAVLALLISSACRNMWVSLGIGVICIFAATMIVPGEHEILSFFPFAMPFQIFEGADRQTIQSFLIAGALELMVVMAGVLTFIKVRREVI